MASKTDDCSDRQSLIEEFEAWNRTLTAIHEVEVLALLADDLVRFESLQPLVEQAREFRSKISKALQDHIREHGC